ncbi:efflux RND transporter periplasmic adaptor subunit [Tunicatimonas pelagia]|uniref:efflux RND transporter periplasmic adaptor subunit n=1 Tax=Tunicatimonas pelagia TaxID=931531 RepID=UPI002664EF44|nr:efflux RND transporter periplasmic adaptor subunit [Tunicatimonas pelagia]WKN43355.1 efflux RND transporter periplasmic adaptor subunit [Tunicatimonas pelagia]
MKTVLVSLIAISLLLACGSDNSELAEKKQQLKTYQQELKSLEDQIATLENEIAEADPSFAQQTQKTTLVTTLPVVKKTFEHYIEVRGSVTSRKNITISAEAPAMVTTLSVSEGESVRQGQVLVSQNGETIRRNIQELQTSLELAKTRYDRQKNLWDQNIGTELQYLEAENGVKSLERRVASLQAQLNNYIIRAPFSGTVDEIYVREGEIAQPGVPVLRLVSLTDMFIEADISEAFLGEFQRGDSVDVDFPSLDKSLQSTISSVGKVINQNNRTFKIEVKLPNDMDLLRPNLLSVLRIMDYQKPDAIVVPTKLILEDAKGDFLFVAKNAEEGEGKVAGKQHIDRGQTYNNETVISEGLQGNETLIDKGFREVAEGVRISIATEEASNLSLNK